MNSLLSKHSLKLRLKANISTINYWLNNYKRTIWVIGDGRSGTTWLSDLINSRKIYREMFEPFHPRAVTSMRFLAPHQYVRPESEHERLKVAAASVFSGKFFHERVDGANRNLFYQGLLVKDIFANLFACWVAHRFPKVKILLLLRNPFAVAASKSQRRNWLWMEEPLDLLQQEALVEDWLAPFEDVMRSTSEKRDYILNQVMIWSVINFIPLKQFKAGQVEIVFYEDLLVNTRDELARIGRFILPDSESGQVDINLADAVITRPSRSAGKASHLFSPENLPATSWRNSLTKQHIDEGLRILQSFGFDELYDASSMPNWDVIRRITESSSECSI